MRRMCVCSFVTVRERPARSPHQPSTPTKHVQVDDGVRVDPATNRITHIAGEPLDPARLYSLATTYGVVAGIDDLRPILDYR